MYNNPFSIDRAEQLGDRLFEFYSNHRNFEGLLKNKSLILEGGRGSGKTMFFLYHSYFNKKKEALSQKLSFSEFFSKENLIGIYFRADSNFVPAFQHKGINEDEWTRLFGHFLNISLSKRLIEVIIDINLSLTGYEEFIELNVSEELSLLLSHKGTIENFEQLLKIINNKEIELITYINNINYSERPTIISNGYLLNFIANNILNQKILKDKTIHFFIDEYENMLLYQQRIVNTLIKHPNPVIIDVGMRNKGLKTNGTFAESEIISAPHDFSHFNFDQFTIKEYEELLIDICEKRLMKVAELQQTKNSEFLDIRYYLGEYNIDDELNTFITTKKIEILKGKLKFWTREDNDSEILYNVDDPILLRLNLVLLERGNKPSLLVKEYKAYLNNSPSKYKDWIHNNRMGVVYLMCKENSRDKLYYGFKTYKSISSGTIRFFIELCESAFKNAFRNSFNFESPRQLTFMEQSDAAYHVSQYKVNDIETYTPFSNKLKRFVMLLGYIFEKLHRDKRLSEPERNHFSTEYDKLSDDSRIFLKNAELYSVLQKKEETKDKSSTIDSNNIEYHLNHIYAPYFQISPRRIRSLKIDAKSLDVIINGDSKRANEVANSFIKSSDSNDQLNLF